MRRIIGWIAVVTIILAVSLLLTIWGGLDENVLSYLSGIGSIAIGVFVGALFGWFIAPLLDTEE